MGWSFNLRCEQTRAEFVQEMLGKFSLPVYAHRAVGNHLWVVLEQPDGGRFICLVLMDLEQRTGKARVRWAINHHTGQGGALAHLRVGVPCFNQGCNVLFARLALVGRDAVIGVAHMLRVVFVVGAWADLPVVLVRHQLDADLATQ